MKRKIIKTYEYEAIDGEIFSEEDYGDAEIAKEQCEKYEEHIVKNLLEENQENKLKVERLEIILKNTLDCLLNSYLCNDWDENNRILKADIGMTDEEIKKYYKD